MSWKKACINLYIKYGGNFTKLCRKKDKYPRGAVVRAAAAAARTGECARARGARPCVCAGAGAGAGGRESRFQPRCRLGAPVLAWCGRRGLSLGPCCAWEPLSGGPCEGAGEGERGGGLISGVEGGPGAADPGSRLSRPGRGQRWPNIPCPIELGSFVAPSPNLAP